MRDKTLSVGCAASADGKAFTNRDVIDATGMRILEVGYGLCSFAYKPDEWVAVGLSSTCGIRKRMAERDEEVLGMFEWWFGVVYILILSNVELLGGVDIWQLLGARCWMDRWCR